MLETGGLAEEGAQEIVPREFARIQANANAEAGRHPIAPAEEDLNEEDFLEQMAGIIHEDQDHIRQYLLRLQNLADEATEAYQEINETEAPGPGNPEHVWQK